MCMYSVHVHVHACSNVHAHDMLCSHNTKSIIALKSVQACTWQIRDNVCVHMRTKILYSRQMTTTVLYTGTSMLSIEIILWLQ